MADERPTVLRLDFAEAGATEETLKATETVVMLLQGFSAKLAKSILMNAVAMVICHFSRTETDAVEQTKTFRKEIERCIRVNYARFEANRTGPRRAGEG